MRTLSPRFVVFHIIRHGIKEVTEMEVMVIVERETEVRVRIQRDPVRFSTKQKTTVNHVIVKLVIACQCI